jgi:hypothetical protein
MSRSAIAVRLKISSGPMALQLTAGMTIFMKIPPKKNHKSNWMNSQKLRKAVTPAQAGVQVFLHELDSRFRGNDENGRR